MYTYTRGGHEVSHGLTQHLLYRHGTWIRWLNHGQDRFEEKADLSYLILYFARKPDPGSWPAKFQN